MTTMTRLVPLNSIFNDFIRSAALGDEQSEVQEKASFVPAVDVYENEKNIVLRLELPGVKLEDMDIRMENQRLTVKGERRFETEEKAENFHRIERRFGSFVRSFTLPQTVDPDGVSAAYDAGVLTIRLSKKAEAQPKQIKIEAGASQNVQPVKTVEGSAA